MNNFNKLPKLNLLRFAWNLQFATNGYEKQKHMEGNFTGKHPGGCIYASLMFAGTVKFGNGQKHMLSE